MWAQLIYRMKCRSSRVQVYIYLWFYLILSHYVVAKMFFSRSPFLPLTDWLALISMTDWNTLSVWYSPAGDDTSAKSNAGSAAGSWYTLSIVYSILSSIHQTWSAHKMHTQVPADVLMQEIEKTTESCGPLQGFCGTNLSITSYNRILWKQESGKNVCRDTVLYHGMQTIATLYMCHSTDVTLLSGVTHWIKKKESQSLT